MNLSQPFPWELCIFERLLCYIYLFISKFFQQDHFNWMFWWELFWDKSVKIPTFNYLILENIYFLPYPSASLHLTTLWSTQGGELNNTEARVGVEGNGLKNEMTCKKHLADKPHIVGSHVTIFFPHSGKPYIKINCLLILSIVTYTLYELSLSLWFLT